MKDFFKQHSIEDIKAKVVGELNELTTGNKTYFYGNGEITIITEHDSSTYEVTNVRGFDELVEV